MDALPITPAMDRRNGWRFLFSYSLIFFAAPVMYIDVVQAALCHQLGASSTVANLPAAVYLLGGLAPLLCSILVPHRLDRAVVVTSYAVTTVLIGLVFITLALRLPAWVSISALVAQGLLQGFSNGCSGVFTYQCLARGLTTEGRARAFKRTFALTPIMAVLGSLGAQYVLNGGFRKIPFPYDFALLYAGATGCMSGVSVLARGYELAPVPDTPRPPLLEHLGETIRRYFRSRDLVLLFFVYMLWFCALSVAPNLSLYAGQSTHRQPKELAGFVMAIRFGCKAIGGYVLGMIAQRAGFRASVVAASLFLALSSVWGRVVPGLPILAAFGFLGAGELGGAYIPNFALSLSSPENGARNLSILGLAAAAASFAPTLHGALADHFGFPASFCFGLLAAIAAIGLTLRIRTRPGS